MTRREQCTGELVEEYFLLGIACDQIGRRILLIESDPYTISVFLM